MAEESSATVSKKNGGKGAAKSKTVKPAVKETTGGSHPTTAVMVIEAVTKLAGKGGSSLYAIKRHLADAHSVILDNKQTNNIRKTVKKLVETGKLVQTKGTGATGSFKLASGAEAKKKPMKKATESSTSAKSIKSTKKTESKKVVPASNKTKSIAKSETVATAPVDKKATAPKNIKTLKKAAASKRK